MSTPGLALPRTGVRVEARPGGLPLGLILGSAAFVAAQAVALLRLDHLGVTFCALKVVTGIPCPTCGGTRAAGLLAHLDLPGALAMNPLVALCGLALVLWALIDLVLVFQRRSLDVSVSTGVARALRLAAVAALGLNWLYLVLAGR